jgi:protein-S-isoprenylcysteine O-methyltransferase Ste14
MGLRFWSNRSNSHESSAVIHALEWMWIAFAVYWLIAAHRGKAAQTSESPLYRIFRLLLLAGTFTLIFANWTGIGFLGRHFLPPNPSLAYAGFAFALAGMALAIWARISLGQYWSDKIVLKVDHQLIRSGPYARMRHPIYSGVLLGVAGSAMVVAEWRGVLAFLLLLTNYMVKAMREDKILEEAFPRDFAEHEKNAGFLLPRLFQGK